MPLILIQPSQIAIDLDRFLEMEKDEFARDLLILYSK